MNVVSQSNFYGRNFKVTSDVLTPRPETEQLIDVVLGLAGKSILPGVNPPKRQLPENPKIYDIGTGSGCIAITLKKELPDAEIIATDVSEKALKIAKANAANLGAPILLIISHLLDFVKHEGYPTPDLVVANLPYVDKNWDWLDKESLKSDPDLALYAKDGGLELIKQLIDQATDLKIPRLIFEADPSQHSRIIDYAKSYDLESITGFILSMRLKLH